MSTEAWDRLLKEAKKELVRSDEIHGTQTEISSLDMLLIVAEEAAEFNARVLRLVNKGIIHPGRDTYTELVHLLAMILKAGRNVPTYHGLNDTKL